MRLVLAVVKRDVGSARSSYKVRYAKCSTFSIDFDMSWRVESGKSSTWYTNAAVITVFVVSGTQSLYLGGIPVSTAKGYK